MCGCACVWVVVAWCCLLRLSYACVMCFPVWVLSGVCGCCVLLLFHCVLVRCPLFVCVVVLCVAFVFAFVRHSSVVLRVCVWFFVLSCLLCVIACYSL